MPYRLRLTLEGPEAGPFQHGIGLRTAVLGWVHAADPELAAAVRAGSGPRPYTISPLSPTGDAPGCCMVEIGVLEEAVGAALQAGIERSGPQVRLGTDRFALRAVEECDRLPWEQLAAPAPQRWRGPRLRLLTPTAFHEAGPFRKSIVVPCPDRYFGSWLRRWNAFAPERLRLPETLPAVVRERVAVATFRGAAERMLLDPGRVFIGFVGEVELRLLEPPARCRDAGSTPEAARDALAALARLSLYCGTGVETQRGMGQTRPEGV